MNEQTAMDIAFQGNKNSEVEDYATKIKELDDVIENFIGRSELHSTDHKTKTDFLKRRNALYSQRKYYRKKLKIQQLEKIKQTYVEKNAKVRKQNDVLEQMLTCAKNQVQIQKMLEERNVSAGDPLTAAPPAGPTLAAAQPKIPDLGLAASRTAQLRRILQADLGISPQGDAAFNASLGRTPAVAEALGLGLGQGQLPPSQVIRAALLEQLRDGHSARAPTNAPVARMGKLQRYRSDESIRAGMNGVSFGTNPSQIIDTLMFAERNFGVGK